MSRGGMEGGRDGGREGGRQGGREGEKEGGRERRGEWMEQRHSAQTRERELERQQHLRKLVHKRSEQDWKWNSFDSSSPRKLHYTGIEEDHDPTALE
ncbi:unnamed protein product [Pleuronectes platessa]|uniref:Uncharacterized protein n=1 Tax=Pleuronectes platessa TaxID=8262 RepID=A0A9N7U546_PLEPL|nr:unnamed protein product [Pleuronectes platessa]